MMDKRFHLVSLGCAKNTVDSESMAQLLQREGYQPSLVADTAEVLIVNTCGFIGPAKEESYQALSDLAANKRGDQWLIAAGCLSQRYGAEVIERVPGVDALLGTRRWMDVLQLIDKLRRRTSPEPLYHLPDEALTVGSDEHDVLRVSKQGYSAYLKIADGCRRPCAFCAIPLIKGTLVSRPMHSILAEARALQAAGVREINLIAQDITDWGHELGVKDGLATLLEALVNEVPHVDWIRILYNFPGSVTDRQIETMAAHKQLIPYLDMPLQHAHPATLKRMRRPANMEWVHRTLAKMRANLPGLALRSTFIVGYPGETEEEFQALMDFVEEIRFDRVGVFTFSFEPGTSSEPLGDPVPEEIKEERKGRLMEMQQRISLENNQALVGQTIDVLIEGTGEVEGSDEPIAVGRSYRDAPEIDGLVFVEGGAPVGEIIPVRITGAMPYDLSGVVDTSRNIITLDGLADSPAL
ncbi:MAG TPA: 30S ribosomal protein S12 methylthiotransferase RimO [Anaerolineales bacterium]|nr:30S ribosomal protein S12 methylthiotransferase RimO [Anaerolineales bacterium]HRQ91635.1 30S ribosomal protein S12 methylthiotransferase RimO [Anaerolineales bacterium]